MNSGFEILLKMENKCFHVALKVATPKPITHENLSFIDVFGYVGVMFKTQVLKFEI